MVASNRYRPASAWLAPMKGRRMLGTILIIILILAVIGALPSWGYSRGWGYFPSGGLGLVLVIIIVLVLMHAV